MTRNLIRLFKLNAALASFTIVWVINEIILSNISKDIFPDIFWIIKLVTALGLFSAFYQIINYLIENYILRKISPENKILGDWYQIFYLNNPSPVGINKEHIRFGKVSIELHDNNIAITAQSNKHNDNVSVSHWSSDQVSIKGAKIWIIFSSASPNRGNTIGTMEFSYQKDKLSGLFHDSSPAKHFGYIELFKHEKDYKEKLTSLFQS